MRSLYKTLFVRRLAAPQAIVATPQCSSFDSVDDKKLATLSEELSQVVGNLEFGETIIIDLSAIERFGSGFLRVILDQASALKRDGVRVIICGDQTGLVKLVRADKWITVLADLCEALNHAAASATSIPFSSQAQLVVA